MQRATVLLLMLSLCACLTAAIPVASPFPLLSASTDETPKRSEPAPVAHITSAAFDPPSTTTSDDSEPLTMLFALMDRDGDGTVSVTELREHFLTVGSTHSTDLDTHQEILALVDANNDQLISFDELSDLLPPSTKNTAASTIRASSTVAPPQQIHLALTGDPTSMLVKFVSLGTEVMADPAVVVEGLGSFKANATTYTVPSRCVFALS